MSSFTASLGFVKQFVGENTNLWGGVLNSQLIDLVDQAIAQATALDVTLGDVTLTSDAGEADQARSAQLIVMGNPSEARTLIVPMLDKLYVVANVSGQNVTVRTSTGSGVTLADDDRKLLRVDGAGDVVVEVSVGSETVEPGADEFSVVPCDVDDAIEGTTEPTYRLLTEGHLSFLRSDGFTVRVNSVAFIVRPQAGTFDTPELIQDKQIFVLENGVIVPAFLRLTSGVLVINKADSTDWTLSSVRTMYAHEYVFSTSSI